MISGGAPVASLMKSGGVSRPIGHKTNIVSVKKWGGQSPPKPPCSDAYAYKHIGAERGGAWWGLRLQAPSWFS